MTPIVNGFKDEFGDRVAFVYLDALDNAEGQRTFDLLTLPGHPSYVLFSPDGVEAYRAFGIVDDEILRATFEAALQNYGTTDMPPNALLNFGLWLSFAQTPSW